MEPSAGVPSAVLVLAGGEGRRLGGPKAWIPWDGRPLLVAVVERLASLAPDSVWVAARAGQELPAGPFRRADDAIDDGGPLAGLAAGLGAIALAAPDARVAVAACDYPFADPALFLFLARKHPGADLVLPRSGGHLHPLHGIWRAKLAERCLDALSAGERRVRAVVDQGAVIVDERELEKIDARRALLNVNDLEDLDRARTLADPDGTGR